MLLIFGALRALFTNLPTVSPVSSVLKISGARSNGGLRGGEGALVVLRQRPSELAADLFA